ncbi:MAG: DNA-directed RNA polymerase subunit beta' [bacterium]
MTMAKKFIKKTDNVRHQKRRPEHNFNDFDMLQLGIASPEEIRANSYGEIRKPETINYRTFKPERSGLFCERIFGPVRDWECNCGKYKWVKHKGIVCDRCGVEVTESRVRRERMGHIELAVPVSHVWFLRKSPSRVGSVLNMRVADLEKIVYYARYVVFEELRDADDKVILPEKYLLSEEEYQKHKAAYGTKLKVGVGSTAIRTLLEKVDLQKEADLLREKIKKSDSDTERSRMIKRLRVIEGFIRSNNKPEWMIMTVLPVIPPDLRPLVPLEGGRFATSDLNDLYRRIINRNNRLKHIEALRAPEVMIHNEKRLLQEAVDALIENGARGKVVVGAGNRPLKSLSDIIKGKQGRFRQNLLGKRVDYSGRSVIVVGPELKINQCGLPKEMALELFKPFIIHELMKKENVTLKAAKRMLERVKPEIWDILEQITRTHPVLLNRAPTLHRLGIQAFEPVLVEGKAIRLHPLTCAAFNADFDGDQMAVHVPLTTEAQLEAKVLMLATNNILSPASGKPIAVPSQDMVLGCCYLTRPKRGDIGEGKIFGSADEVIAASEHDYISMHAKIKVTGLNIIREENLSDEDILHADKWTDFTTVGRVIFNEVVPEGLGFINKTITKKEISMLVEKCYKELGQYQTINFLDDLKRLGFKYSTQEGATISVSDMKVPGIKEELIKNARSQVKEIGRQAKAGVITDTERYNKIIDIWTHVTERISDNMFDKMKEIEFEKHEPGKPRFNSIFMMADSGARGSRQQVRQLAGMRGLMAKPQKKITGQVGEIIESPVISNFREGLSVLEYFISTHGGRKGLADTALKTADAGYLTRRLVDVSHDVVIYEQDCGTINGVRIGTLSAGDEVIEPIEDRITGRIALDNVMGIVPTADGELHEELLIKAGEMISRSNAEKIAKAGIDRIRIRSVLTCESERGVCANCYGLNLATSKPIEIGEAVGIIAAQSIGEPGTQLTLRTFHIGGTASRVVKRSKINASGDGTVKYHNLRVIENKLKQQVIVSRNGEISVRESGGKEREHYNVPYGARLMAADNKKVTKGTTLVEWDPYALPIITEHEGTAKFVDIIEGITMHEEKNRITGLIERVIIEHRAEKLHPQVIIIGKHGKQIAAYTLPVDTYLSALNGEPVVAGDIVAKIPQEVSKTKDITGGLPRVAELFEARKPKNMAVISEIDGVVKLGVTSKGMLKVTVTNEETTITRDYTIPQGKHLVVYENDHVGVGEPLTDGAINPHDILRVRGSKEVQEHLVNEIQEVYRLQGVTINDKHIEIIVRQMLSNIKVSKTGESSFIVGETINKSVFEAQNKLLKKARKTQAGCQPVLLGITKAALSSKSFISAASFQETTRILTDAAVNGDIDELAGLKENVIIGKLIPAGTGIRKP